jgi:hypothetical protein
LKPGLHLLLEGFDLSAVCFGLSAAGFGFFFLLPDDLFTFAGVAAPLPLALELLPDFDLVADIGVGGGHRPTAW